MQPHRFPPSFAGLARFHGKLLVANVKIVGGPTDFGKCPQISRAPGIRYTGVEFSKMESAASPMRIYPPHLNSGSPEFSSIKRSKSETSDFDWGGSARAARRGGGPCCFDCATPNPSPQGGRGAPGSQVATAT